MKRHKNNKYIPQTKKEIEDEYYARRKRVTDFYKAVDEGYFMEANEYEGQDTRTNYGQQGRFNSEVD